MKVVNGSSTGCNDTSSTTVTFSDKENLLNLSLTLTKDKTVKRYFLDSATISFNMTNKSFFNSTGEWMRSVG